MVSVSTPGRVILSVTPARGFDRGLLAGITRYTRDRGPWLFYRHRPAYLGGGRSESLAELAAQGVDGIICPANRLGEARRLGVPVLVYGVNEDVAPTPSVWADNAGASRLAAEHLMGLGLRHYAFCGFDAMRWSRERCASFAARVERAGYACNVYRQARRRARWVAEQPRVSAWLAELPKPAGIYCANDDLAALVAERCRLGGLSVPDDVAIVGVDNDRFVCELTNPPLTSVAMATEQAGYQAAELLGKLMNGQERPDGQRIVAPVTHLVTRRSTDVLFISDPLLRRAVRYVRDHANRVIRAGEVVKAMGVSFRTLNDRFRKVLGCSILKEITRLRAEYICRMLIETNRPIARIALDMGYPDYRHIARYFRRAIGMSPSAYRQKYGSTGR